MGGGGGGCGGGGWGLVGGGRGRLGGVLATHRQRRLLLVDLVHRERQMCLWLGAPSATHGCPPRLGGWLISHQLHCRVEIPRWDFSRRGI